MEDLVYKALKFNYINQNIPWIRLPGVAVLSMILAKDLFLFGKKSNTKWQKTYQAFEDVPSRGNGYPSVVPLIQV